MSTTVGRLQPADRPGLSTWAVADIAARDALTHVDDAGQIPIVAADVGRVCRVGTAEPYRYFELLGVGPLAWAEYGAPGQDGEDGPPGADGAPGSDTLTRLFQLGFYVLDVGAIDGAVLAQYVVPPIDGTVAIAADGLSAYAASEPEAGAAEGLVVTYNGTTVGQFVAPIATNAALSGPITLSPGDVLGLVYNQAGATSAGYQGVSLSVVGQYSADTPEAG